MKRSFLSRPLLRALEDGVLRPGLTVFDYGCGRGDDLRHLRKLGYGAEGWDPAHAPNAERRPAAVVNLGYVVNVIEDRAERSETLRRAWDLAEDVLVVSARLIWEKGGVAGRPHGDGLITGKGTFQKFYEHDEFRAFVESTLAHPAVPAGPGVLYVFRHTQDAQRLLASVASSRPSGATTAVLLYERHSELLGPLERFVERERRLPGPTELSEAGALADEFGSLRGAFALVRRATESERWAGVDLGRRPNSERRFEVHRETLEPLMTFVRDRGRLPRESELEESEAILDAFGSIRAAFSLVRRVTGPTEWAEYERRAREDFDVYLALAAFGGRPRWSDLPEELAYDVRDFYGTYKVACGEADRLLFSTGDRTALDAAFRAAGLGKLTPEALYVHVDALPALPPLVRVYEGCARTLSGLVEEATLLKLHRERFQVSYLVYPDFARTAHPALRESFVCRLARLEVSHKDFSGSENPPILHRKELFVPPSSPDRTKYERLTRQEERAGLLSRHDIGTQRGWERALRDGGYRLRGHRLVRT